MSPARRAPIPGPRCVLFDLMDTLVVDPFYGEILEFLGTDLASWQEVKDYSTWVAFELGQLDHAGYCGAMYADRRAVDPAGLEQVIRRSARWIDGMPELLARVGRDRAHVLSNYPLWWRWIDDALDVRGRVGHFLVSCEIGLRKPDPRVFALAAERIGVPATEVVFVDDRARNVEAAESVGMTGIVFETAPALGRRLRELGITSA